MIYKNWKYGNVENVTILEFGRGDILVASASSIGGNHESVIFKTLTVPIPIGTEDNKYIDKTTDDYKPEVVMVFNNIESIDVVLEALNSCREKLINN